MTLFFVPFAILSSSLSSVKQLYIFGSSTTNTVIIFSPNSCSINRNNFVIFGLGKGLYKTSYEASNFVSRSFVLSSHVTSFDFSAYFRFILSCQNSCLSTLKVLDFANLAIFEHFRQILYPRKLSKPQNR